MNRRDFTVDLDGTALVCARFETASGLPPLLLVPGTMGNIDIVSPMIAELARHFSVVAFDQPGTNGEAPSPTATPERLAHVLGALCAREFAGMPVTIYGISLGAVVAALIARARPSIVRALVLDDPVFSPGDYSGIAEYAASAMGDLASGHPAIASFKAFTGYDPHRRSADGRDYRHLWREIGSPVLVLAGEAFKGQQAPDISIAIERHAGHPVWAADPGRIAARSAAFAAAAPPPPAALVHDDEYALRLTDGTVAICPREPTSTSTIILLERETWFEDEFAFVRSLVRPGWRAVDGGANLGVYTLTLARAGADVLAFEPNPPIADRGARAIALNGLSSRIHHRRVALGAATGTARFDISGHSENARLAEGGTLDVPVVTLDDEIAALGWTAWDFLKLDLEGGETDALRGGRGVLARFAPLVMSEIVNADTTRNFAPMHELIAQGFALYALLPGPNALVPLDLDAPDADPFLAYGFGALPARAKQVAAEGRLVENVPQAEPLDDPAPFIALARSRIAVLALNPAVALNLSAPQAPAAGEYIAAIARFERARHADRPLPLRVADFLEAERLAKIAYMARPGFSRALTYARIARAAGRRGAMIDALGRTLDAVMAGTATIPDEPLIPALERYESLTAGAIGNWFSACLIEAFVSNASFAAGFNANANSAVLWDFLESANVATPAMHRARQIQAILMGAQPRPMPHPALARFDQDNLNPEIWRGL